MHYQLCLMIGLTKESGHWDELFVEELKTLFKTEDVVRVDIPGAGEFVNAKTPLRIPKIIRKTRPAYALKLHPEKQRILISISLGGMMAAEWSRQFPEDFHKIVIINSSYRTINPLRKRVQPKAMKEFVRIFMANDEEEKEKRVLELCSNNEEVRQETHSKWVEIAKKRPVKKRNMVRQTIAGAIYKPRKKPSSKMLIIAAEHDRLAHYECSLKIYQEWGGDLYILKDEKIGHGVHIDAPETLAFLIHGWTKGTNDLSIFSNVEVNPDYNQKWMPANKFSNQYGPSSLGQVSFT